MDGLTVAQSEYGAELKARRDAEAEITRLRVLLSGQAARITVLSGPGRQDELHKQLVRELSDNLNVLEHNVSQLKVERDVALVEMAEIATSKRCVISCAQFAGSPVADTGSGKARRPCLIGKLPTSAGHCRSV
jgi:Rho-type GTPase-activating protein 1/2